MLGKYKMGVAKRTMIMAQIYGAYGSIPEARRIRKLIAAIEGQQSTKQCYAIHRLQSRGSVQLRLQDIGALNTIVPRLQTTKPEKLADGRCNFKIKLFKGHTPPKRRARVGDVHEQKNGIRGLCVGWNLWAYSNGTRLRLEGNRWVSA
jgi:hypothetical protein